MLLFIIFVLITVGGIVWHFIAEDEWMDEFMPGLITAIGVTAVVISIIVILFVYAHVPGTVAANEEIYDSLVYQYEHDLYENDNDVGKRELIVDIQNWNKDLARNRVLQSNRLTGIFIPDIYDQFEFIELE